uniref:Ras association (RalGDS/AF-6) and pleckstrin homology domains 1 n=1 Tax=Nothobranchius furzeri TaxID=105023 RepID=A0A8C6NQ63_NOTFU
MDQLSDDEVEVRGEEVAEEDSDKEDQDLDKMFGAWLGELNKLTQSLDDGRTECPQQNRAPLRRETNMANFYRFSIYNINEALNQGENVDLDSLMADLSSIEQELSTISTNSSSMTQLGPTDSKVSQKSPAGCSSRTQAVKGSDGGGGTSRSSSISSTRASPAGTIRTPSGQQGRHPLASNCSLDDITAQLEKVSKQGQRLHQRPENAAVVSLGKTLYPPCLLASVSSPLSSHSSVRHQSITSTHRNFFCLSLKHSYLDNETSLILRNIAGKPSHLLTKEEQAAKMKAEKIRVALEKIKEAQVKKLVIRVHLSDESSKTMMVDERQTVRQVLDSLLDKSHCGYSPDWSLVETISELQMGEILHENICEETETSSDAVMASTALRREDVLFGGSNYLLGRKDTCEMSERNKEALLEECFGGSSVSVPEMEGVLWLKEDSKKSWKKRYFLLRASGIYYVPKSKGKASRDLVCFLQLDHVNVYLGQDYKDKYKAPTDHCMVLKYPQIQKKSQYIKYLCCDDLRTLQQWINSIRIAKYGKQLYINFQDAMKRAEATDDWSSLSSTSIKSASSSSSLPESQSCQSDSGVSEMTSSGHIRSQRAVSSTFSEAWRKGTQGEAGQGRAIPTLSPQPQPQTRPFHTSYMDGLVPLEDSSPSSPSPPRSSTPVTTMPPSSTLSYSTLAQLQDQNQSKTQESGGAGQKQYATQPVPASSSAMVSQKFRTPSPTALPSPPPLEEEVLLPPPPPESPEANGLLPHPPSPNSLLNVHPQLSNAGLQQFLAEKFPNMVYDFSPAGPNDDSLPLPPPPTDLSPPASLQPLSPNASSPAAPKTFIGSFPPQTAPKLSGPSSLPFALSPMSPTQPPLGHGHMKKQQSFSTGHSPNQPPPTLPKQHSLSSRNLSVSPTSSSPVSFTAATSSLVKKIVNQFPGSSSSQSASSAPQSPPAVKVKPKWQPGTVMPLQSPEFPPPPPEESLGDFPSPPSSSSSKTGSPIKKSPSSLSTGSTKWGPPLTPQKASYIRDIQDEKPKKVESLLSKFGQPPQTGTSSSSSSATGSPSKDSTLPAPLPKPGKLNLANLPLVLQGLQTSQSVPPPPPPHPRLDSSCDFFPPPPSELELLPPPPAPSEFHHPPKVAIVNPQPQMLPPPLSASSLPLSRKQGLLKKGAIPSPVVNQWTSNVPQYDNTISLPLSPPPMSQTPPPSFSSTAPPTSPKSPNPACLAFKPHFLEDLNRTLKRKSVLRHGSLTSSSKMEPVGTMDDMALTPPPPPELLQQQQQGLRGQSHTLSRHHRSHSAKHGNISGYATLRRGPPPAPPKRDQSTKLTSEW